MLQDAVTKVIRENGWKLSNLLSRNNIFTRIALEKAETEIEKAELEAIIATRMEAMKLVQEVFGLEDTSLRAFKSNK